MNENATYHLHFSFLLHYCNFSHVTATILVRATVEDDGRVLKLADDYAIRVSGYGLVAIRKNVRKTASKSANPLLMIGCRTRF